MLLKCHSVATAILALLLNRQLNSVQAAGTTSATVVNTWAFTNATSKAWEVLQGGASALDAVEQVSIRTDLTTEAPDFIHGGCQSSEPVAHSPPGQMLCGRKEALQGGCNVAPALLL